MSLSSRLFVGLATFLLVIAGAAISQHESARALDAGHMNNWYWPQFAYSPLTTIPVYECIDQDPGGGPVAWNLTGLVAYSAPISSCSPPASNRVYYKEVEEAGCEGFTTNNNNSQVTWVKEPESGVTPYYPTISVDIEIPTGCSAGSTVYAHELGHSHGLHDHYTEGTGDCSNNYVPATIMNCPGYTTVQSHDTADVTWQYRSGPFNPDSFTNTVQAFNKIRLKWQERSHNERQFRIERSVYQGSYSFLGNTPRDSGSYNNYGTSVKPNTRYCYRLRAEGAFNNIASFVTVVCPTAFTPHSVGTVSGSFSGSNATFCGGRISGSGATSYKVVAYRWSTGQLLSWTVSDNTGCFGAVLWPTVSLAADYYHIAAAGCNSSGCSEYRDMTNPNQYWTQMPGGGNAGCCGDTNYHVHEGA